MSLTRRGVDGDLWRNKRTGMCTGFYLAAETAPPSVEWYDGASLVVKPLGEDEAGLRELFSLPHVVSLGAYSGCSCGFGYSEMADPEEKKSSRASQSALIEYLGEVMRESGRVELMMTYYCGDMRSPERTLCWDLDALRSVGEFDIEEGDFVVVTRGPEG